jgi:uncharacterized membrane protein
VAVVIVQSRNERISVTIDDFFIVLVNVWCDLENMSTADPHVHQVGVAEVNLSHKHSP